MPVKRPGRDGARRVGRTGTRTFFSLTSGCRVIMLCFSGRAYEEEVENNDRACERELNVGQHEHKTKRYKTKRWKAVAVLCSIHAVRTTR